VLALLFEGIAIRNRLPVTWCSSRTPTATAWPRRSWS